MLQLAPRAAAAQVQLARLDLLRGAPQASAQMAGAAVKNAPGNRVARLLLAKSLRAQGQLAQAEQELDILLRLAPDHPSVQTELGMLRAAQGKRTDARAAFERAIERDSGALDALEGLARLDVAERKIDRVHASRRVWPAARAMRCCMSSRPGSRWPPGSRTRRSRICAGRDLALQLAKTAKAELPDRADVSDTLGFVYLQSRQADLALAPFREAVGLDPSNPAYRYRLGVALHAVGQLEAARRELTAAVKMGPFPESERAQALLRTLG